MLSGKMVAPVTLPATFKGNTFSTMPYEKTLNIPIFDGGRRKGNLANAQAVYEEDVADYRQQVLVAFREVEDNLSDLRILEAQTATQNISLRIHPWQKFRTARTLRTG